MRRIARRGLGRSRRRDHLGRGVIVDGVSILFGIWGDLGALLLIVTLIALTFLMHRFRADRDPAERRTQSRCS